MSECFITLKRTPEDLVVVLSRTHHDFWKALYNDNLVELAELYGFVEMPLASVKWLPPKYKKPVYQSWQALSKVRSWDADLLYNVLAILYSTAPVFPKKNLRLPVLNLDTEPPLPKKTAANPRGLLAKKGKKQKPKSLPAIDLRPYLCDPKNVSAILYKLKPFWDEAVERLQSKFVIRILADKKNVPSFTVEPHLALRHPESRKAKSAELPRNFAQHMLFWLAGQPWKKVKEFLSLYHKLGLERDEILLGAVARLLSYSKPDPTLTWLKIVRDLPSGKRYSFLLTLLETDAYDLDFAKYPPEQIRNLANMIPYQFLERRLEEMFWTFRNKVSIQYLTGGFQLAKKFGWDNTLELRHDAPDYPTKKVEELISWLQCYDAWVPMGIWKWFGGWDEWQSIILRSAWRQFSFEVAWEYIQLILKLMKQKSPARFSKRTIQYYLETIDAALNSIPPKNQVDFIGDLEEFSVYWNRDTKFKKYLRSTCDLLKRLSTHPNNLKNLRTHEILGFFIEFTKESDRQKFSKVPSANFIKLDKACRTDNNHQLVKKGMFSIIQQIPAFSVGAFLHAPAKLSRIAKKLGTLRFPQRQKIVKQFARHPLLKIEIEKISPKRLYQLIEKYYQPAISHPVPKKLQDHFKEKSTLSETRIPGYHEKSKNNFLSFVLDVLDQHILDTLSRFHPAAREKDNWEHALQFLNWVESNRRGFKNFLKAYFSGNNHYVENHPETKKWFAKHKKVNKELWNQGILFCRRMEKYGPVRIELEKDPLEILKMGTYVGSCLSLGGSYAYSAVAVLLDLNKQVLYARDQNNKVLGRQLVALSEKDELVCFDVYPLTALARIKNLFFEYNIDFAKALDIDLYEGDFSKHEDGYPIRRILSNEWWDDYPWDKIAPEE